MNRSIVALAVAVVGFTVGCSSTSSSGGTAAGSTTTSIDGAASSTTTSVAITTTTAPAASTTVVVTVAPTVAPAPPVTNAPKPPASTAAPAPAPAPPRLDSVSLKNPVPSCNPGDVLTLTIEFSGTDMAAVSVYSSYDGELGQYPAEYESVDVPYTCNVGQTDYTLTPVANGGAMGTAVTLSV